MKILKFLLPTIALLAITLCLTWTAFSRPSSHADRLNAIRSSHTTPAEISKKGDDGPWDPGDERGPHPKPHRKHIAAGPQKAVYLAQKKSDGPWDPGDESPDSVGVHNA